MPTAQRAGPATVASIAPATAEPAASATPGVYDATRNFKLTPLRIIVGAAIVITIIGATAQSGKRRVRKN